MVKTMHLGLFSSVSLPYSHPPCKHFTPPSLTTQALERIKIYFADYKWQISNRLAGIGHPTKGLGDIG